MNSETDVAEGDLDRLREDLDAFLHTSGSVARSDRALPGSTVWDQATQSQLWEPARHACAPDAVANELRAFLLPVWVARSFTSGSSENLEEARRIAVSVRALVAAAWTIDDIQDESPMRYNRDSVHSRFGATAAMNAALWLVNRAIAGVEVDEARLELLSHVNDLIEGQCFDLAHEEEDTRKLLMACGAEERLALWRQMAIFKTSRFFTMAGVTTAVALGVRAELTRGLQESLDRYGEWGQLWNDLADFHNEAADFLRGPKNRIAVELLNRLDDAGLRESRGLDPEGFRRFVLEHPHTQEIVASLTEDAGKSRALVRDSMHALITSDWGAEYLDFVLFF